MTQKLNPDIGENIRQIRQRIAEAANAVGRSPDEIELMAVTKTVSSDRINSAYVEGISLFGENRVQEYIDKFQLYSFGPEAVHFIGHLQTNKVKYIIDKVSMIESGDSMALALEIDKRAAAIGKIMPILLEINIANEISKTGFSVEGIDEALKNIASFSHLSIQGLMCIPERDNTDYYFAKMKEFFEECKTRFPQVNMRCLSMGMSGDYETAVRQGSTLVRIGSSIFGERNYTIL